MPSSCLCLSKPSVMAIRKGNWELPQLEEQHSGAPCVSSDRDIITLKSSLYFEPVELIKPESTLQKKKRGMLTFLTGSVWKHPSLEDLCGSLLSYTSGCYYPKKKKAQKMHKLCGDSRGLQQYCTKKIDYKERISYKEIWPCWYVFVIK